MASSERFFEGKAGRDEEFQGYYQVAICYCHLVFDSGSPYFEFLFGLGSASYTKGTSCFFSIFNLCVFSVPFWRSWGGIFANLKKLK
jgi:hypothetical protein